MIKKIKVSQLRPGIFVHDFDCGLDPHNIFINKTLIKSSKSIDILKTWGIQEVYIDTERGLDVKRERPAVPSKKRSVLEKKSRNLTRPKAVASTVPLKEEAVMVRLIKQDAVDIMEKTVTAVQKGTRVDIDNTFRLVEKMEASVSRNKDALVMLTRIREKNEYTLMHSISVTSLVLAFCNYCKIPSKITINMATGALLHDIGKIHVPLTILDKPGKLEEDEFVVMKKHSEFSAQILSETTGLPSEAFDIALHHHERYDGTGYPHGLQGDAISFCSRVTSICDVYDAITSDRCYRPGLDSVVGLQKIYEWSGDHFDMDLAYKFIRCIGVYPIGAYVRLENDLTGVVTDSTENMLQPVVRLFYDNKKKKAIPAREINLQLVGMRIAAYDFKDTWPAEKILAFEQSSRILNPFF